MANLRPYSSSNGVERPMRSQRHATPGLSTARAAAASAAVPLDSFSAQAADASFTAFRARRASASSVAVPGLKRTDDQSDSSNSGGSSKRRGSNDRWELDFPTTRRTSTSSTGTGTSRPASSHYTSTTATSAMRQKAEVASRLYSVVGSSNYLPRFNSHAPPPGALSLTLSPSPSPCMSPSHSSSPISLRTSRASPYDAPRSRSQARSASGAKPPHTPSPSPLNTSPFNIPWPLTVSLQHCANKASRELIEYLMRKYQWREATDQTATLLWTDAKVARSYKSFRTIAQTSSWFNGGVKVAARPSSIPSPSPLTARSAPRGPSPPPAVELFPDRSAIRLTNHLPDMHQHVTKARMARSLALSQQHYPGHFDFFPLSFDLGIAAEAKAFQERLEKRHAGSGSAARQTWILKPHAGRQGEGIVLVQKWSEVTTLLAANPGRHYVASEYIADPLLLDGFKWDARVYVLVESLQPFKIHLFKEGLARLCTTKYAAPTPANIAQSFMHLSNYSLNKFNEAEFQHAKKSGAWNDFQDDADITELSANHASKRSIRTALAQLRLQGVPISLDSFWDDVGCIVEKTLCSMWPALQGAYNRHFPDADSADTIKSNHHGGVSITNNNTAASPSPQHPTTARKGAVATKDRPASAAVGRSANSTSTPVGSLFHRGATPSLSSSPVASSVDGDFSDSDGGIGSPDSLASPMSSPSASPSATAPKSWQAHFEGMNGRVNLPAGSSTARAGNSTSKSLPSRSEPAIASPPITSFPVSATLPASLVPTVPSHCFHLLGFDILLDSNLKCWLLEVNAAPSLNLDSSLDKRVKLAVLERSFEIMGLIPPASVTHAAGSVPLFDPDRDLDDETIDSDEDVEEIDTSLKGRSAYATSSNVIARPTLYKTDVRGGSTLEEKEMQHTKVLQAVQRKYTALDLEYKTLRPDQTLRSLFPFGSATLQRMYLTFTTRRFSSGLSLGAFNRLISAYGIVQRTPSGTVMTATGETATASNLLQSQAGESDLIFLRCIRRTNERVMSFSTFCDAMIALAVIKYPQVAARSHIDAFNLLIHEVERRQSQASERSAARKAAACQRELDAERSTSPLTDDGQQSSPSVGSMHSSPTYSASPSVRSSPDGSFHRSPDVPSYSLPPGVLLKTRSANGSAESSLLRPSSSPHARRLGSASPFAVPASSPPKPTFLHAPAPVTARPSAHTSRSISAPSPHASSASHTVLHAPVASRLASASAAWSIGSLYGHDGPHVSLPASSAGSMLQRRLSSALAATEARTTARR